MFYYLKSKKIIRKIINFMVNIYGTTKLGYFINDIANSYQKKSQIQNNYIFETFKINSFKALFSYDNKNINYLNLIKGKYFELINILDLTDIDILFSDIYMTYPKNNDEGIMFEPWLWYFKE